jgi:soluble lytic murein transglycosylase-like protein/rubrerythrin
MATIDFAALDLRSAFDFAIMIEEDAQNRYAELARRLGADEGGAGDVFRRMVETEGVHRRVLVERRAALFATEPPRFEISVVEEGVERPLADDDELPTTARGALEIAAAAEHRAEAFYARVAPTVKDPAVREFFERLMREETDHALLLEREIAALAPAPARAPSRARPVETSLPRETYPDRGLLEEALPRFDAATRIIAEEVIVRGRREKDVAESLGVLRSTVSRKLSAFLALARRQAAVAAAAATLAGCAGSLPHADPAAQVICGRPEVLRGATEQVAAAPERAPEPAPVPPKRAAAAPHDELAAQVRAQVASRMKGHEAAIHEKVAGAILAEAKRASLDPLLVLALIHVESSFNPVAVSSAGAVGLMQLLEPTMRSELQRSKLPAADPRDPIANVRAGVRYLRRLIDAFGDTNLALMAYNAGPNRIRGYLRGGGIPERFHVYPERINRELDRLRFALERRSSDSALARADAPTQPRG